jgi:membrane associated rhomboid family serine protease
MGHLDQVAHHPLHRLLFCFACVHAIKVAHIAHLGGALAGVLVVLALSKLPKGDP